jgi:hypothetical protein
MIRYRLQCKDAHEFEAWFRSSSDYDSQVERGEVSCPSCGSGKVSKALMSPQIATSKRETTPEPAPALSEAARRAEMQRQFLAMMQHVRREVEKKADYVGDRFAEEARKIHYEEAKPRGIYGEATPEEARKLDEEGIEVLPLPPLPEDHN